MPQPVISGVPPIFRFGNAALPNGQGTMTNLNLNDGAKWQWQRFKGDDDYVQITVGQLAWRAASVVLGRDRKGRTLSEPMRFLEATSAPADSIGAQLGLMEPAGLQQITFDGSTYIAAEFAGFKSRDMVGLKAAPYYWLGNLEFFCPIPYFNDLSATTYMSAVALNGAGLATNTNVTYLGSISAKPVWTLTIPAGNAAPIQSFALSNTMSGETLTIPFPGLLAASTAWTITIDSGAFSVTDASGKGYDLAGSFPNLYGPAGQVQQISATLTPASGTATGCSLACVATNRWLI